jgi:hypothetical protein
VRRILFALRGRWGQSDSRSSGRHCSRTATVTSVTSSTAAFNLSSHTLSTTGTYTITINPSGAATGSIGVQVTTP